MKPSQVLNDYIHTLHEHDDQFQEIVDQLQICNISHLSNRNAWMAINLTDGTIHSTKCTCMQQRLGQCIHIGALLYMALDVKKNGSAKLQLCRFKCLFVGGTNCRLILTSFSLFKHFPTYNRYIL